jgi:hypothetical protein
MTSDADANPSAEGPPTLAEASIEAAAAAKLKRGSFVALDVQALDLLSVVVQAGTVDAQPAAPGEIASPIPAGATMGQA